MAVRSALIVASAQYEDARLKQLRAPGKDAEVLARVLGDPNIGDFDVQVVLDGLHARITRAISRFFRNRESEDLLLLHLSCHGIKDEDGHLYAPRGASC
jgi:molecular chaperone DnaJ